MALEFIGFSVFLQLAHRSHYCLASAAIGQPGTKGVYVVKFYKFGKAHFFIVGKFMIYWGKNGASVSFDKLVFLDTVR